MPVSLTVAYPEGQGMLLGVLNVPLHLSCLAEVELGSVSRDIPA